MAGKAEFTLVRYGMAWASTLGRLIDSDGKTRLCYTLEDEYRAVKVPGRTCIPEGRYKLFLRHDGRLHAKYKALYPEMHKGMLFLDGVPGFSGIALHRGLYSRDTDGCPLLGNRAVMIEGEFELRDSADAYERVYPTLIEPILKKIPTYLRVVRRPDHA
jgi:hypothetical protein